MEDKEEALGTSAGQMSVIGSDITITGNIEARVDLNIEGIVVGDVQCGTLILGEGSAVKGGIYAERVKVSGVVEGSISAKDVVVEASASVTGDITYERLRVSNGATIDGKMSRRVGIN